MATQPSTETVTFAAIVERAYSAVRATAPDLDLGAPPYTGDELALTLGPGQPPLGLEERFDLVCRQLDLDPLERAVVGICAAPEIDADLGRMFAYLHDDATLRAATPRLVAQLLAGPAVTVADVLICFDRAARLSSTGAIRIAHDGPLADRPATVGTLLACHLLGSRIVDDAAAGRLRRVAPGPLPLGRGAVIARIAALLQRRSKLPLAVVGPDAVLAVAAAADRGVVVLDAPALADEAACADLALCAVLEDRIAVIDHLDELAQDGSRRLLDRACSLPCCPVLCLEGTRDAVMLADHAVQIVELPRMTVAERAEAWRVAAGVEHPGELAARFRLDAGRIGDAVRFARAEAELSGLSEATVEQLWAGARAVSSGRLGELARRLVPGPTWQDLILPPRQTVALHALSAFLRHRQPVVEEWGYRAIAGERGLTALFAGESGTGKTLAARVIAQESGLDVYRVDLAGLFSKWVGETEKNLDRIFNAGERASAVLFFDEADVVFGKRTESSDSADRYANLETAFLLQRIEAYEGVVVLATNLRSNMDDAFVRRLDIVVDFPPPDGPTRRRLWDALLPSAAPLSDDIDLEFLATRFELSGGGIRNCSLAAALLAAEEGDTIHMRHFVRAVAMEFAKLGRLTVEADFGSFHQVATNGRAPASQP